MLIVMPRAFSSGALSIWSYALYSALPSIWLTFVIAAVSVVLPWSMCPIVPTFRCGLFLSYFCFAMMHSLSKKEKLDFQNFGCHGLRRWGVMIELHAEDAASFRDRAQLRGVPEHLCQRNHGADGLGIARAHFHALDIAAAAVE